MLKRRSFPPHSEQRAHCRSLSLDAFAPSEGQRRRRRMALSAGFAMNPEPGRARLFGVQGGWLFSRALNLCRLQHGFAGTDYSSGDGRGFQPGPCHLQENIALLICLGRLCPAQTLVGKLAVFLRRRHDTRPQLRKILTR